MKKSRADRYKDSPTMKRDEESGTMKVTKKPESTSEPEEEQSSAGIPSVAKHGMERMALHGKHEQEHFAHDHSKSGDKTELSKRHVQEFKDMHSRHNKESK